MLWLSRDFAVKHTHVALPPSKCMAYTVILWLRFGSFDSKWGFKSGTGAPSVECLLSMKKAQGLVPSIMQTKHGGAHCVTLATKDLFFFFLVF